MKKSAGDAFNADSGKPLLWRLSRVLRVVLNVCGNPIKNRQNRCTSRLWALYAISPESVTLNTFVSIAEGLVYMGRYGTASTPATNKLTSERLWIELFDDRNTETIPHENSRDHTNVLCFDEYRAIHNLGKNSELLLMEGIVNVIARHCAIICTRLDVRRSTF